MELFELREDETRAVGELVTRLFTDDQRNQPWNAVGFADWAAEAAQYLPERMRRFLIHARQTEADVVVVSGLPISEDLPPTPAGWERAAKSSAGQPEELLLMTCGAILGEPFSWASQQSGRMVHDVCPARGHERSLTSASSEMDLALHTEDVHHPCRSDYVALLCLRNLDEIGTTIVRADNVDLPRDVADLLAQPHYRFHADDSHVAAQIYDQATGGLLADYGTTDGSILFGPRERPYLRIDKDFTSVGEGGGATAENALLQAFRALGDAVERIVLKPGDAVFLDNYRVVHGREAFVPRYDGTDRWLKRVNLIRDIRRVYVESGSRSRVWGGGRSSLESPAASGGRTGSGT